MRIVHILQKCKKIIRYQLYAFRDPNPRTAVMYKTPSRGSIGTSRSLLSIDWL
uniref:Uncharacterized protein n=1 Tax=Zea mays TaxID=4577 RepID=C4IZZ4_MAIZE|nr:unknown [Zea mays]